MSEEDLAIAYERRMHREMEIQRHQDLQRRRDYERLLEPDRRYERDRYRGMNIREEVTIQTACGCQKVVSMPQGGDYIQQTIELDQPARPVGAFMDRHAQGHYMIRRFSFRGQLDRDGRRLYQEIVDPQEPWEQRYRDLYQQIYGMDKGL